MNTVGIVSGLIISIPIWLIFIELKNFNRKDKILVPTDAIAINKQKLQINAYERLALLCTRIQPDKLALRMQSPTLNVQSLSQALIVGIQQEFDHNVTQQIFVSESLWSIITLAKEEALYEVMKATADLEPEEDSSQLTQLLLQKGDQSKLNIALQAIRKEAKNYVKY